MYLNSSQFQSQRRRTYNCVLIVFAALMGVFAPAGSALAFGWDTILGAIGYPISVIVNSILFAITWFFGNLISLILVNVLVIVASYNDFASEWGVQLGWQVVRDITNMFFIVVLLIIAVATIFKVESYSYRSLLPKLIVMAILVNFSRTITGFFIDLSQVIMLTFVNAFRNITAATIIDQVGLGQILSATATQVSGLGSLRLFGAMLLGIAVAAITCGVLLVFIVVLAFRIVMLWILTVLSPMAFLLSVFPGGQKYSSQWWEKLASHLIVGPVLAFFLWLSFTIMQNNLFVRRPNSSFEKFLNTNQVQDYAAYNPFDSPVGQWDSMVNFIIVIGLLLGSLTITSQLGVLGGAFVGTVSAGLTKMGWAVPKAAGWSYEAAARKIRAGKVPWLGSVKEVIDKKTGKKSIKRTGLAGIDFSVANLYKRIKAGGERKKEKDIVSGQMASAEGMKTGKYGGTRLAFMLSSETGAELLQKGFIWKDGFKIPWKYKPEEIEEMVEDLENKKHSIEAEEDELNGENAAPKFVQDAQAAYTAARDERQGLQNKLNAIQEEFTAGESQEATQAKKELKLLTDALQKNTKALEKEKDLGKIETYNTKIAEIKGNIEAKKRQISDLEKMWKPYKKEREKQKEALERQQPEADSKYQEALGNLKSAAAFDDGAMKFLEQEKKLAADSVTTLEAEKVSLEARKGKFDTDIASLQAALDADDAAEEKRRMTPAKREKMEDALEAQKLEREEFAALYDDQKNDLDKAIKEEKDKEGEALLAYTEAQNEKAAKAAGMDEAARTDKLYEEAKKYYEEQARKKREEAKRVQAGGASDAQIEARKAEQLQLEDKQRAIKASIDEREARRAQLSPEELRYLENEQKLLKDISNELKGLKLLPDDKASKQEEEYNQKHKIDEGLEKEAKKLDLQAKRRYSEGDRENISRKLEGMRQERLAAEKKLKEQTKWVPQDYYALADARHKIEEESRKVDTESEDELIQHYANALANKDMFLAAAVMRQAARVGHLNELVNEFGIGDDGHGEDQSDVMGLHSLINERMIKQLGMSPQWALNLESDVSDLAQSIHHWAFAQAVGVEHGKYVQRSLITQRDRAFVEQSKRDFETRMRNANRLGGWFTERWADPQDHSKGKVTDFTELGLYDIRTHLKDLPELVRRGRFNPNIILHLSTPKNWTALNEFGKRFSGLERTQFELFKQEIRFKAGEIKHEGIRPGMELERERVYLHGRGIDGGGRSRMAATME